MRYLEREKKPNLSFWFYICTLKTFHKIFTLAEKKPLQTRMTNCSEDPHISKTIFF